MRSATGVLVTLAFAFGGGEVEAAQGDVSGTLVDWRDRAVEAVVYLVPIQAPSTPPEELVDRPPQTVVMDQIHLRFQPSILAVTVGATVEFLNSDPIMHNVFSPPERGGDFDLGIYPATESRARTFTEAGSYLLLCHVHPEMAGWVIVLPGPEYTMSDSTGRFTIQNVDPGVYEARAWYRRRDSSIGTLEVPSSGLADWKISLPRVGRR